MNTDDCKKAIIAWYLINKHTLTDKTEPGGLGHGDNNWAESIKRHGRATVAGVTYRGFTWNQYMPEYKVPGHSVIVYETVEGLPVVDFITFPSGVYEVDWRGILTVERDGHLEKK